MDGRGGGLRQIAPTSGPTCVNCVSATSWPSPRHHLVRIYVAGVAAAPSGLAENLPGHRMDKAQRRRHPFITLALATLALYTAETHRSDDPAEPDTIRLSVNEIGRLTNDLII